MKKYLIIVAALCGMALPSLADGEKEINVLYVDGTEHVVKLAEVDKIELGEGSVNVVAVSGSKSTYKISDIDKIEFRDAATSIAQLRNGAKADVTVRSTGYNVEVAGLADGEDVMVYSQSGMLVGKAKSNGGNATVDVSGCSNGVYVVKAGGRSLKMVKR